MLAIEHRNFLVTVLRHGEVLGGDDM